MPDIVLLPNLQSKPTSTLTPEIATKIVEALRLGCSRRAAAHVNGVPEETFYHWLEKASARQEEPYISLLAAVLEAEAAYERARIQGGLTRARSTEDELRLLSKHPSHRDLWGDREQTQVGIVVQLGVQASENVQAFLPTVEAAVSSVEPVVVELPTPEPTSQSLATAHTKRPRRKLIGWSKAKSNPVK